MDDSILLLGQDHVSWGEFTLAETAGGRTAAALSVGADPNSPSMASKGDLINPNEDALLCADQGQRTLLAVADAHRGHQASHQLLRALDDALTTLPTTSGQLNEVLLSLRSGPASDASRTTLLVAVFDRAVGSGFGISFGDSSLVRIGPASVEFLNVRRAQYLRLEEGAALDPDLGYQFGFFAGAGELIAAFTDGVDECHYRSPATSIGMREIGGIFAQSGPRPRAFARRLVQQALDGVGGNPGGQDNIALVVSRIDA